MWDVYRWTQVTDDILNSPILNLYHNVEWQQKVLSNFVFIPQHFDLIFNYFSFLAVQNMKSYVLCTDID